MKPLTLIVALIFQLISLNVFSQKHSHLNSLLNKNSEFIFPQTPDKISKVLRAKAVFYEDANDEKYAKWLTKSGLELYCSIGKNNVISEMFFDIPDDKFVIAEGLPFGLAINKTTLQESKVKFSKYGAKVEKLNDDSMYSGGSKLIFKKGEHYSTLLFDNKNILKSLGITKELIDPAAN
ncbi:hypothetical protein ASG22_17445 [Chryseobacterium sp. Leaf405]|uniref:hypothetical protein n=1 Tax=Chryseobacterium sp. Leaf405 TaxID=1736367 RepID=UPI0006F52EEB|nr:hypothetical protein [Chryseobacterium sp. Leaf405]KQT33885.1 hypothetical protein ASG22_17445 [Chryseobacterium sp. Leaf405]